jgi:hypothetical protein
MPDPQPERFQQTLRRDLLSAMQPVPARGLKAALILAATASVVLTGILVSFIASPDLPRQIHTAMFQGEEVTTGQDNMVTVSSPSATPGAQVEQAVLRQFLEAANAGVSRDQDFLETWFSSQARPTQVKAVHDERILAIRQFDLANGERVAVLTDLGAGSQRRTVRPQPVVAAGQTF